METENNEKPTNNGVVAQQPKTLLDKVPLDKKDLIEYAEDFAKNPIVTFVVGAAAGYAIGANQSNKELRIEREEHKKQMEKKDDQIFKALEQMQLMNERLEASLNGLPIPKKKMNLEMEEDPTDKKYKLKQKRKQFKLTA